MKQKDHPPVPSRRRLPQSSDWQRCKECQKPFIPHATDTICSGCYHDLTVQLEVEREAARLARLKAQHQFAEAKRLATAHSRALAALQQIVWLADADDPLSVKAAQISQEVLREREAAGG